MLAGLDLAGRARAARLSCREFVRIGNLDPRNVGDAALASANGVAVLHAWVDAGEPDADLTKLRYYGHPDVRRIVELVLATIPTYARWWAVTRVLWLELGRGDEAGCCGVVFGSPRYVIMLKGTTADEVLPAVVAHELAHAIHIAPATTTEPQAPMPAEEWAARVLAAATMDGGDDAAAIERAVRWQYRPEVLANDLARLWGYSCAIDGLASDAARTGQLSAALVAARGRAAEVLAEVDQQFAAINQGESR